MEYEKHTQQSLAKVERSTEIADEIFEHCREFTINEDNRLLVRAGSLLGDYTNNLRSALNYCARNIILNQLKTKVGDKYLQKLSHNLDFPWAKTQKEFDNKPIIKTLKSMVEPLYKSLEQLQPYYQINQWLEFLMRLTEF